MRLDPGTCLGPYEILNPIGKGGMGEVYRARDTRLDRVVAVKVLGADAALSAQARPRFEREARTISQLSHPHICALYDVGQHGGTEYLVMELLEGETLAARIGRGPLSIALAIRYAAEIAAALAEAHRRGIVHRDLKPANVMITASGVKLLDFGLAKAAASVPTPTSNVDTAAAAPNLTAVGTLAGTIQYMAPEQLEGRSADARSDIFALGSVIYEMVTGKPPFVAAGRTALISAIMHAEPAPISGPDPSIPPLDRIVRVCLAKEPDGRWQSAHDIAVQLSSLHDAPPSGTAVDRRSASRRRLGAAWPWLATAGALSLALALAMRSPATVAGGSVRFLVPPPAGGRFPDTVETVPFAVSPDGLQLAMLVIEADGRSRVWLRAVSSIEMRPVEGTEGADGVFWSPDSRSLGFFAGTKLKRVDAHGGAVVPLCDVRDGIGKTGSWARDGQILFAPIDGSAILRTSTAGEPAVVERARGGDGAEVAVRWPSFLPDGRYLYLARSTRGSGTLMLAERGQPPRAIGVMASTALYVDAGYILFTREGTLLGQRFDGASGRLSGEPFSIANPVRYFASNGWSPFSASARGTLAYQAQGGIKKITWFDRLGRQLEAVGTPAENARLRLSADGRTAALDRVRPGLGTLDIWSIDLARGIEPRLTSDPGTEAAPAFVPGANAIVFSSTSRGGVPNLLRRNLDTGAEEFLTASTNSMQMTEDVSADGKTVLFSQRSEDGNFDLLVVPAAGPRTPSLFLKSLMDQQGARFSPDGRFVAFMSNESGQSEIYLAPFGVKGVVTRVSSRGGRAPRWSRDGRELFFLSAAGQLMVVPAQTAPALQVGEPAAVGALADTQRWSTFEVAPDGKFLAIVPEIIAGHQPLTVVVNWTAEIR